MRLSGKVAVITGAARGLGRACATAFAAHGADLVLIDVAADIAGCPYPLGSAAQLETSTRLCRRRGASAVSYALDIRDGDRGAAVVDEVLDRYGRIDVLVNNAGLACPSGKPVHEVTEPEWRLMIDVDLTGAWQMLRCTVPSMLRQRSGSVVTVASSAGLVGYRHFAGYVAAKHGLIGLTRAAALDYAPFGIRVNAVCPGSVRDEPALEGRMLAEIAGSLGVPVEEHERTFIANQPNNRLVAAAEVANTCLWLASDESRDVTGSVVSVDGGFVAR